MNQLDPNMLSLIIPAYRCTTIAKDLSRIALVCRKLDLPFELICVIDGTAGRNDPTFAKAKEARIPELRLYHYRKNRGKGFAVRYGFKRAKGSMIGFIDAGNDIHVSAIRQAVRTLRVHNADAVIGSKHHLLSTVNTPWQRKLYSKVLKTMIWVMFGLPLNDTQAGIKIFTATSIRPILSQLKVDRWAFDLEILATMRHRQNIRVIEIPIKLTYNFHSNIDNSAVLSFLSDFWKIYWRLKIIQPIRSRLKAWQTTHRVSKLRTTK